MYKIPINGRGRCCSALDHACVRNGNKQNILPGRINTFFSTAENLYLLQTLEEQPTIEEEFNLNYRQIYPLLRLTPEQKKRVKVSFEIFKRRCEEVSREREELREQINTIDNSLRGSSGVDRCRYGTSG